MATSFLNWRIGSALIVSVVILGGAIVYTHHASLTAATQKVEASETDALLKEIASRDTDHDGLPDWQEELYGTSINNAHSVDGNVTDADAVSQGLVAPKFALDTSGLTSASTDTNTGGVSVPGSDPVAGSLTDEFAHVFFEQYIQAGNGQPLDEAGQQELIKSLLAAFTQNASTLVTSHYTAAAERIDDSVSTMAYVQSVETVLVKNDLSGPDADIFGLLTKALENNDQASLAKLTTLANTYRRIASDLSRVAVPRALAETHLSLMKSFDVMAQSTALAANLNKDPLATLAGLSIYATTPKEMGGDFVTLATAVVSVNGIPAKGAPGYLVWALGQAAQGL